MSDPNGITSLETARALREAAEHEDDPQWGPQSDFYYRVLAWNEQLLRNHKKYVERHMKNCGDDSHE